MCLLGRIIRLESESVIVLSAVQDTLTGFGLGLYISFLFAHLLADYFFFTDPSKGDFEQFRAAWWIALKGKI